MPKESAFTPLSSIENTDFFRMVTAAGLSKNAPGEIVKAFIGGSTIAKVNDYYYFQDAENPVLNDYRFFANGIYMDLDRYNGSAWVNVWRAGGSVFVPQLLEIIKDVGADIFINADGEIRNLIKSATYSDGVTVGDIFGDTFLNTEDKIQKVKKVDENFTWDVVQSDDSLSSTGTSFSVITTTPAGDGFVSIAAKVKGVGLPAGLFIQGKAFLTSDLSEPVWRNVSDEEFAAGIGTAVDEVTGEIDNKPNFYALGGAEYKYVINFSEEVTLLGSNITADDVYFELNTADIEFQEMTDESNVKEQYEAKANTNAFTDAEKSKLAAIPMAVCGAGSWNNTGIYTTVTTANNWYKVEESLTNLKEIGFLWNDTLKRWEYIGLENRTISIFSTFSSDHNDGSTRDVTYKFKLNGADVLSEPSHMEIEQYDTANMSLMVPFLDISTGDYLELFVSMDSSGDKVYTKYMNMLIR